MIGFYNYTVLLTYLGTAAAVVGIIFAFSGHAFLSAFCLLTAGVCDMFDGAVAKTRKRTEIELKFGVWIDSLSDLICFGVLPSVIGYSIGLNRWFFIPIFILYVLAALIRLAYFGVTELERNTFGKSDRTTYDGLPVTTAALIFPLVMIFKKLAGPTVFPYIYGFVMLTTALAFVSKFKVKKLKLQDSLILLAIGFVIAVILLAVKLYG